MPGPRTSCHASQDVAAFVVENLIEFIDLNVMQHVQVRTFSSVIVYPLLLNIQSFSILIISLSFCKAMAISKRMKSYSSDAKKALKKSNSLEFDVNKVREKLVVEEATRKARDETGTKSKLEADAAQEKLHKALWDLVELQKVARCIYGY